MLNTRFALPVVLLASAAFAACAQSSKQDVPAQAGSWDSLAELPYRVQEIYPALHQGQIWVAGGFSPDVAADRQNVSDRVVIYSPADNTWSEGPPLPEPRHHPVLVSTGESLWAFGGFVVANGGRWSNSRDVLQLTDAGWEPVARLPQALSETVAGVIGGKVHLATGRSPSGTRNADWTDHTDTAALLIFDPATLQFTRGPDAPVALNSAAGAVLDARLYVVGGRTVRGGNKASLQIYDPATGQWTTGPDMPQAQGGLAAAVLNGKLHVFGGEYFGAGGGGVYAHSWVFDPAQQTWSALPDMPVPRHGLGAVALGDVVYVVAGATRAGGDGTSARLSRFTPLRAAN